MGEARKTPRKVTVKVNFHRPGEVPEQLQLVKGDTTDTIKEKFNLDGYVMYLNGNEVTSPVELKTGDMVRVAPKLKNGNN